MEVSLEANLSLKGPRVEDLAATDAKKLFFFYNPPHTLIFYEGPQTVLVQHYVQQFPTRRH